ncbi:amidohydrolase [Tichowtungia aerotolerans]|uniref:Amidohydrolase family protein n=1 Tax=Tichowtungia aerotolerans TaxID=2697043 RepID=A0A6P1MCR3_9BACT|nr:amidohydrolase [Tichowtungia aerotolerans]QHI70364.1 amidohydrolase family protein [Tichowtungia aerotolerans]
MSILIQGVQHNDLTTDVFINGNVIETIGDCKEKSAETVIDGSNKAVLPTFHNAHHHAAMAYMRSYADDLELFEWLNEHIWPLEAGITEDDVYHGARLACLEMIKSGTTFFNDMYWHFHGTARAVEEMGMRAALGAVFIDMNNADRRDANIEQAKQLLNESKRYSDRIQFQLGPHALYTVSKEALIWCSEFASEHGLMIHTHLSETEKEVEDCLKLYGIRPPEYLDRLGLLGPNLTAAHCVWLNQSEMELLAERGVKALHCPTSNMKLCSGKFRFTEAQAAGIQIAIGTDGAASNNNLCMIEEIKIAALLEKHFTGDPTALPATVAWHSGTRAAAEMFGLNSGIIQEGALADLMLVNLDNERLVPGHQLIADMVYSADSCCVNTVICDGKILMQNHHVPGEEEIIAKGREFREKFRR